MRLRPKIVCLFRVTSRKMIGSVGWRFLFSFFISEFCPQTSLISQNAKNT